MVAVPIDESVVIQKGANPGDPTEITINCPDKVGLGCDLARTIFEFGLSVVKGDLSTDGRWCFLVFWVVPRIRGGRGIKWSLLKHRIAAACPSSTPKLLPIRAPKPKTREVYLLQVYSVDRTGFLNDVTQALWEVELTIQKVNVSTSPDGKAVDLFFVTDNRDELPAKPRIESVCERVREVLGEPAARCEIRLAGPVQGQDSPSTVMPVTVEEYLLTDRVVAEGGAGAGAGAGAGEGEGKGGGLKEVAKWGGGQSRSGTRGKILRSPPGGRQVASEKAMAWATVSVDNAMSPGHSMLQVKAHDRKGLVYDCLRALKDAKMQVAYGRIQSYADTGSCLLEMFVLDSGGRKVTSAEGQKELCLRIQREIERPIRITVVTKGPDSELLIGCPIEECGRGRPRVLYDVTAVLRNLEVHVFKADISRHSVAGRQWEVYRFILQDKTEQPITMGRTRHNIEEQVRTTLMG